MSRIVFLPARQRGEVSAQRTEGSSLAVASRMTPPSAYDADTSPRSRAGRNGIVGATP
jgi:hypothetical protein